MTFGRQVYPEIPAGWRIIAVDSGALMVWQGMGPNGEYTPQRTHYDAALLDVREHVAKQHAPLTDGPAVDVGRDPR